jgi:hypothetical protein
MVAYHGQNTFSIRECSGAFLFTLSAECHGRQSFLIPARDIYLIICPQNGTDLNLASGLQSLLPLQLTVDFNSLWRG